MITGVRKSPQTGMQLETTKGDNCNVVCPLVSTAKKHQELFDEQCSL